MSKSFARRGWVSELPTPAQMREFWSQVESKRITKEKFQMFLRGNSAFQDWVNEWQRFYQKKKYFGMTVDLSRVSIPEHQTGFDRLIIVAQGLTLNQVYNVCIKQFVCWHCANDLDNVITRNDRDAKNSSYAVWFRGCQEADEELKNLTAERLAEREILGITLLERLLYELKYWDETGQHLDVSNVTLCTGSRDTGGNIPAVCWYGGELRVCWSLPSDGDGRLRSRAAVPLSR